MQKTIEAPLKVGFIGCGFIADFHLQSLTSVRDIEVIGVFSPTKDSRVRFAEKVKGLNLGNCIAHNSLAELLCSSNLDAVWVLSPNHTRIQIFNEIDKQVRSGASKITAVACEKPLARNVPEATKILSIVENLGLLHGYLENQVFAPAVTHGKRIIWERAVPNSGPPYLARAAEEHSGPHKPWFWDGPSQGGGVLSDMMCHSVEVGRYLLTKPGAHSSTLRLISVSATVANLKWTRPEYAKKLKDSTGIDFLKSPVEDFARGTLEFEDPQGNRMIVEASTSWGYVGAGLRIAIEMQGPEYSMEFNSLNSRLNVFMSRNITGEEGEDLVEKQNAEQGLMPIAEEEINLYGYVGENRHMVESFLAGEQPDESFEDGLAVVEMLMALYKSAEEARTVFPAQEDLSGFIPMVAK